MKNNHLDDPYRDGETTAFESSTHSAAHKASNEFHHFLEDIESLIAQTTSLTGDDLEKAKEKISHKIMDAKQSLEKMSDSLVTRVRHSAAVTDHYVHEQPWSAIAVSAAVGAVIGFLVSRRI